MIEAVNPGLRVRLGAVYRTDVVRLAEIVPGGDLDKIKDAAIFDDVLPASVVQMRVGIVDPLCVRSVSLRLSTLWHRI